MIQRWGVVAGLAWVLMLGSSAGSEPGPSATAHEVQTFAFDLVNVGEFDRAREAFERLAGMKGERLAKTAWFHWGNLIETYAMMDAASLDEVRKILVEAAEAHRRALEGVEASPDSRMPHLRSEFEAHVSEAEANLARLERIEQGEIPLTEAAVTLDDMNAANAAASLLDPSIDPSDPTSDTLCFLALLYRVAHMDHLYLRLGNIERAGSDADLGWVDEATGIRTMDALEAATVRAAEQAQLALDHYAGSPHWLDFLTFAADAHRYRGLLELVRAESEASDAGTGSAAHEARGIEELRWMNARTQEIVDFAGKALKDRSLLSVRQAAAYSPDRLESYLSLAEAGLAESRAWVAEVTASAQP